MGKDLEQVTHEDPYGRFLAFVMAVEQLFILRKEGDPETGKGNAVDRTPLEHLADLHDLMGDGRRLYNETVAAEGRSYEHDLNGAGGWPSSEGYNTTDLQAVIDQVGGAAAWFSLSI